MAGYIWAALILLLTYQVFKIATWDPSKYPLSSITRSQYDYIVVGAGSAGCVLANRLSEDANVTVLLLEAGSPDTKEEIHVPFLFSYLIGSEVDWKYFSVPQKRACFALEGQRFVLSRGKVLGGTSAINAMVYSRGSTVDFDRWEEMGAEGWGYEDVLPYFKKSEDFEGQGDQGYHGFRGPLSVKKADFVSPVSRAFLQAGKELGYSEIDLNGKSQVGLCLTQQTVRNGVRWSTAKAFLHPVRDRGNLFVATEKVVRSLEIEGDRVTGVHVVDTQNKNGSLFVRVQKEVILSGGTIGSSQILMLSGIGPWEMLDALNVTFRKELPVGKNLQDHFMVALPFTLDAVSPVSGVTFTKPFISSLSSWLKYHVFSTGPLASSPSEVNTVIYSGLERKGHGPDLMIIFSGELIPSKGYQNMGITKKGIELLWGRKLLQNTPLSGYTILILLLHPRSVGMIQLNADSLYGAPLIDLNCLEHPEDVEVLLKGIRVVQKLLNTSAFELLKGKCLCQEAKYSTAYPYDSDEFWRWYIHQSLLTMNHAVGTCKMGPFNDPSSVVDPQLRVKGFKNLRVVDASVIPEAPSGGINAPVIMIAEKAADMIKEDSTRSWIPTL